MVASIPSFRELYHQIQDYQRRAEHEHVYEEVLLPWQPQALEALNILQVTAYLRPGPGRPISQIPAMEETAVITVVANASTRSRASAIFCYFHSSASGITSIHRCRTGHQSVRQITKSGCMMSAS
jgi:hypothetical protein